MKLSNLINESSSHSEEEYILFEESELNEKVYTGKRYYSSSFDKDIATFLKKTGSKSNPFMDLIKANKVPFADSKIKSEDGSGKTVSIVSSYRTAKKELETLASQYDTWKKEAKLKASKILDDDKATHQSMPKEVKVKLNSFYKSFGHYKNLFPKTAEKAKKAQVEASANRTKTLIRSNIQATKDRKAEERKDATDKFKSNVRRKMNKTSDTFKGAGANFKNKTKAIAASVDFSKINPVK